MGKIKSAIITALLVAAIAVLAFFALFSWQVPGSNGVKRYNSFISNIHLGADLTGNAVTVLYPDGVISAEEYDGESHKDDYEQHGSVYVKTDKLGDNEQSFKDTVKSDAAVLSKRLGERGYTSYSVSVQDDFSLKVAVPTNFTYAAYKAGDWRDNTSRSEETAVIGRTLRSLAFNGELSLRNPDVGNKQSNNILTKLTDDLTAYFNGISKYSVGGNHAVRINLTKEGREQFKTISERIVNGSGEDKAIGFYVGENQLLSLNVSEAIDSGSFFITVDEANAQDYAIVLDSVARGETLEFDYNSDDLEIVYQTAELGDTAAIFLGVAMLLVVVAAIAYSIFRYKKLGLVNAIIILMYSLTLITALMLLQIQLTLAGAVTAVLGLALLCGSNFAAFEAVRKETGKGKTMQSSVKSGYKTLLAGILEMHIILVAAAVLLALVGVGELAACGFIFFISVIASYVLYWFTRFMWYVLSSPAKDKFKFCGFKREEIIDD